MILIGKSNDGDESHDDDDDDDDDDVTPPSECPLMLPVKTITQMAFSCRPIT